MHRFILAAVISIAASASFAAPPSTDSVRQLLALTKSQAMIDVVYSQVEPALASALEHSFGDKQLTAPQRAAIEAAVKKAFSVLRTELSWDIVQDDFVKTYQEVFSQQEVDAMIEYYQSPIGRSVVEKMPQVVQRSNALVQARMPAVLSKVRAATDQALAEAGLQRK